MTSKTPTGKPPLPLPPPPEGKSLGELIQILIDEGVYPTGPRRPRKLADVAKSAGITEHSLLNIRTSAAAYPQLKTFNGILVAFFGKDPSHHVEWRKAMAIARDRAADAKKRKRLVGDPTNEAAASAQPESSALQTNYSERLPIRVPIHFHGRDIDLNAIHTRLTSAPHRVALHGPHGIGKTVLAAAYLDRYQKHYQTVAWIDAATDAECQAGLAAFGRRMSWCSSSDSAAQAVAATLRRLAGHDESVLLVYDNAASTTVLHSYLPNGSAHVLITSNAPDWRSEAEPYAINPWSPQVGAEFLCQRLGSSETGSAASAISQQFDGLPITLELAASFCERRAIDTNTYFRLLRQTPGLELALANNPLPGYRHPVASAFSLSLQAAAAEDPATVVILAFLTRLASGKVPRRLLDRARPVLKCPDGTTLSEDGLESALATLRRFSLIEHYKPAAALMSFGQFEFVRLHRLVRLVVDPSVGNKSELDFVAKIALIASHDFRPEEREALLPHFELHILAITDDAFRERFVTDRLAALKEDATEHLSIMRQSLDRLLMSTHPIVTDNIAYWREHVRLTKRSLAKAERQFQRSRGGSPPDSPRAQKKRSKQTDRAASKDD